MFLPGIYFLSEEEQLVIQSPYRKYTVEGPRVFYRPPFHRVLDRRTGCTLDANEYVHVKNMLTGHSRLVCGPTFFFLQASEHFSDIHTALPLAHNEYVKVLNQDSGKIKIVKGECSYRLEPCEVFCGKAKKAINIDEHTAVMVRSISTGTQRLVTECQSFVPACDEEIEAVSPKVLLEEHEVVVLQDAEGKYHFRHGKGDESSFFLPPYWKVLQHCWASGLHKENRDLHISRFDLRPKFMWYEFDVRTRDNVELVLKVTFFWQIVDVKTLVETTDDASGDVCSHARSRIIQKISTVDFADFLAGFNDLIQESITGSQDPFYGKRGINIHSVEVREIACKDQRTQDVLSEIIQETTTRINRIQKQVSENEVLMKKIEGELKAEETQNNLLRIKAERIEEEARLEGLKQARQISGFFESLGSDLSMNQKIALFESLKKSEMMSIIAGQNTRLFLTREDVDLKLDVRD
jgi:regulator of protease activity HflC (stomatin/prohibitin superfamily)